MDADMIPPTDAERVAALERYQILDSPAEVSFNAIPVDQRDAGVGYPQHLRHD